MKNLRGILCLHTVAFTYIILTSLSFKIYSRISFYSSELFQHFLQLGKVKKVFKYTSWHRRLRFQSAAFFLPAIPLVLFILKNVEKAESEIKYYTLLKIKFHENLKYYFGHTFFISCTWAITKLACESQCYANYFLCFQSPFYRRGCTICFYTGWSWFHSTIFKGWYRTPQQSIIV